MILRALLKFFIPGCLIFAAGLFIQHFGTLAPFIPTINSFYPYIVLAIGFFLGWRFSRSRLIFTLFVLTFADQTLRTLHFQADSMLIIDQVVYNVITFLVPLNIMVIAFIRERGIFTLRGLGRLGLLTVQPFFIYTLIKYRYLHLFKFLDLELVKSTYLDQLALPQISLWLYIIASLFIIVNFILKKDTIEGGFFWTLLMTFFALLPGQASETATFHFSTAGLILIISILEYSHNVAYRDELTGLPGRRALVDSFLKLPNHYAIAMVDIDRFKKFNDDYGHDVGDQVLRMVASRLMRVSGGGKAYRYGGEEFTLIFPGKCASEIRPHLEQVKTVIAGIPFTIRSNKRPKRKPDDLRSAPRSIQKVHVNVSIGVAERDEKNAEPLQVLKAADQALLRAKKTGRNKVVLHGKLSSRKLKASLSTR